MRSALLVLRPAVVAALVMGQVACFGVRRQAARNHPPDAVPKAAASGKATSSRIEAESEEDDREAQARQRSLEWFNKRHPDGGLRAKAIEQERRVLKAAATTSGQWTAIGPQPIAASTAAYSGRIWGIGVDPRNSSVIYIGTGKWVTNGMTFTVKDAVSGTTLATAKARVVSRPTTSGGKRK